MSSGKNIIKKMSIYFIGNLSTKLLSVLLVPIYAYFVAATDLGEYDYIIAVSNVIFPVVYLVIWEAILRYCVKDNKKLEKDKIISTTIIFAAFVSILFCIIFMSYYFYSGQSSSLIFIMLFSITHGLTSIWQFSARALGKTKIYVLSSFIGAASIIISELFFVWFSELNYISLCISNILSQVLIIIVIEINIKLISKIKTSMINLGLLKKMLIFTIPLVLNNISLYLYNSASKMIIKNYVGVYENGLYSFASKFSLLISLFSTVVSMAVIEEAYSFKTIEEYKNKMSPLITKISKGYLSLIITVLPAIYLLYILAFKNTDYYSSVNYIFILLLGALFTALSNNFGSAFQITDNTKFISITTIVGAICAICFSVLTVNKLGVLGVLLGGTIGPFVMMMARALYAKKSTGLSVNWLVLFGLLLLSVTEYFLLILFNSIFINVIILVITIVIVFVINKADILQVTRMILKKG